MPISEVKILSFSPSLKYWTPLLLVAGFMIVTGIMLFLLVISALVAMSFVCLGLSCAAWATLRASNTEYLITNRRVVGRSGLIFKKNKEILLAEVQEINVVWGQWGESLGVGRLDIESAADTLIMVGVEDPEKVREKILSLK